MSDCGQPLATIYFGIGPAGVHRADLGRHDAFPALPP